MFMATGGRSPDLDSRLKGSRDLSIVSPLYPLDGNRIGAAMG